VTGSDIYIGMNPLRKHALNRTKKDIKSIRHVYLDLDHGGQEALNSVENSSAVPKPNYVLTSSPGKFQIVWKVEGMGLREAEGLLHVMARECAEIPLPPTRRACCVCLVLPTRNMKQISLSRFAKNPRRSIAYVTSN
jgi:RepB DNA-primase from phage plasmid